MAVRDGAGTIRAALLTAAALLALADLAGCSGPKRVVRTPRDVLERETAPARRQEPAARPAPAPAPTTPSSPAPRRPASGTPPATMRQGSPVLGLEAASLARDQVGAPYRWGGASPAGFDCSGLVQYAYGRAGLELPRTVSELIALGREVPAHEADPGDLVFFRTGGRDVSHVGIFLGGRLFVHAPSSGGEVREDRLDDPYWLSRLECVRRMP